MTVPLFVVWYTVPTFRDCCFSSSRRLLSAMPLPTLLAKGSYFSLGASCGRIMTDAMAAGLYLDTVGQTAGTERV